MTCEVYCLHNAIPTDLSRVGSTRGLGLDVLGIDMLSMAARHRTAVKSGTLNNGLKKIRAAREYDRAPIFALSHEWDEDIFENVNGSQHHGSI